MITLHDTFTFTFLSTICPMLHLLRRCYVVTWKHKPTRIRTTRWLFFIEQTFILFFNHFVGSFTLDNILECYADFIYYKYELKMEENGNFPTIKQLNRNLCIFCQKRKQTEDCIGSTAKGYASMKKAAHKRCGLIDLIYGGNLQQYLISPMENVCYHPTCFSDFTNKTHISRLKPKNSQNQNNFSSEGPASVETTDWNLCILCQSPTTSKGDRLRKVSGNAAVKIEELAAKDRHFNARIEGRVDLIPRQGSYHGLCLLNINKLFDQNNATKRQNVSLDQLCDELRFTANKKVSLLLRFHTTLTHLLA